MGLECIFWLRLHPPSSGDSAAWCLQLREGVLRRHPCERMSQECCGFRRAASSPSSSRIHVRRETGKAVAQSAHLLHPILEIEFSPFGGRGKIPCTLYVCKRWNVHFRSQKGVLHSWNWSQEHVDHGRKPLEDAPGHSSVRTAWRPHDN